MVVVGALARARRLALSGLSILFDTETSSIGLPVSGESLHSRQPSEKLSLYGTEDGDRGVQNSNFLAKGLSSIGLDGPSPLGSQLGGTLSPRPQWTSSNSRERRIRQQIARCITLFLAFGLLYGIGRLLSFLFEFRPEALQAIQRSIPWLPSQDMSVAAGAGVSGVTIVSGFFLVAEGRKHSVEEYRWWIKNFLANVEQPIVFFTSPDLVEMVTADRGGLVGVHVRVCPFLRY